MSKSSLGEAMIPGPKDVTILHGRITIVDPTLANHSHRARVPGKKEIPGTQLLFNVWDYYKCPHCNEEITIPEETAASIRTQLPHEWQCPACALFLTFE